MTRNKVRAKYVIFAALAAVTLGLVAGGSAGALTNTRQQVHPYSLHPHPMTTLVSGNSTGAIFEAVNSSFTAFNTFGLEGIVSNAPGGIGVLGFGNNPSVGNYGVYGSVLGPNGTGVYGYAAAAAPSGSSNTPSPSTLSSGLIGLSHTGFGLIGQADWPNNSNITSNPIAGVEGVDLANSGQVNLGVLGMTTNGGYGVAGESGNGALGGVFGLGTNALGVFGQSTSSLGVLGVSSSSTGAEGSSSTGVGVFGLSGSSFGVEARGSSTDALVALGDGVSSVSAPGTNAIYGENNDSSFATIFTKQDGTGPILNVRSGSGSLVVDNAGNVTITGHIFTAGSCSGGCASSRRVLEYTPRTSVPTMEDVGEAQLVSGQAYVRLDPAFANVIDTRSNYLVFITAEGDSNGMYVTSKTPGGFFVRENRSGRSSIAFQYRIVAKPIDTTATRLPMIRIDSAQGVGRTRFVQTQEPRMSSKMTRFMTELRANPIPRQPRAVGPNPNVR